MHPPAVADIPPATPSHTPRPIPRRAQVAMGAGRDVLFQDVDVTWIEDPIPELLEGNLDLGLISTNSRLLPSIVPPPPHPGVPDACPFVASYSAPCPRWEWAVGAVRTIFTAEEKVRGGLAVYSVHVIASGLIPAPRWCPMHVSWLGLDSCLQVRTTTTPSSKTTAVRQLRH